MLQHQQMAAAPPKMGRSRFSKALPSVPPREDRTPLPSLPAVPARDVPDLHFSAPAPLKEDDTRSIKSIARKPVTPKVTSSTFDDILQSTSLPPLPPQSPPSGSMSIPRRPIGGASVQKEAPPPPPPPKAASPRTSKGTSHSLIKTAVRNTAPVAPEPSPTDSISSLISAYSSLRDDELSKHRISGNTQHTAGRTRESGPDTPLRRSPEHDASPPSTASRNKAQSPLSTVTNDSTPRRPPSKPLPPPKDDKSQSLPSSPPKGLPATPAASTTPSSMSPKRPEIWKRRPQNSEAGRELPALKLASSSGSTASTESVQTAVNLATSKTSTSSTPRSTVASQPNSAAPSRPVVAGLPGRNVRPPAKDQLGEPMPKGMGASTSRERRKDSTHNVYETKPESRADLKPRPQPKTSLPPRVDSKRPPTPEYRKSDEMAAKEAHFDNSVAKPASPVSANTSPKDSSSHVVDKDLPPQPPPHGSATSKPADERKQTPTKAALGKTLDDMKQTPPKMALPRAAPDMRAASSTPDLQARGRSPPKESPRGSEIINGAAENARDSASSSGSRPRHPTESPRRPAMANTNDPRIVYSESQGELYRGRDGTLYPEMKLRAEPDAKATYFPIQTDQPAAPGTVFQSKPLRESHFSCFQKHRTMNRRSNRNYPLTCQTCEKSDADDRWVCNFCHLRVCGSCLEGLNSHHKELRRLVDQLRSNTPLSLSSMSRPASALGIELPG